jgi:hypothetical protein
MNKRIELSSIPDLFRNTPFRFLLGLGFDQRGLTMLRALQDTVPAQVIALVNVGWSDANQPNIKFFNEITGANAIVVGSGCQTVLEVADYLSETIKSFHENVKTVIDITSMSHELLSILIALLKIHNKLNEVTLCYTGASKYSFNTAPKDMWLSRGVASIRSVLGYPGEQLPSKPLHLVIPMGFEVERAMHLITSYEPAALSLGVGEENQSVSLAHHQTNMEFFEKLRLFVNDQKNGWEKVFEFSFSCIDPFRAKNDFANHISKFSEYNTVICPLNTKLSTVGAALFCIDNPKVQLCYAQPVEYNTEGYAEPGELITIVEMKVA